MRTVIASVFVLIILFTTSWSTTASAQDNNSPIPFERIRERLTGLKENKATRQAEIKPGVKENRGEVKERRAKNIQAFAATMVSRLEAMIERLDKLIGRIERRLVQLQAVGNDISRPQAQLDQAKNKLTTAQGSLSALKGQFDTLAQSDNPKTDFKTLREKVQSIIKQLKDVHLTLTHIIGSIKGLRVGQTNEKPATRGASTP